jgi:hypothetical protein
MKLILSVLVVLIAFSVAAPAADISGKWTAEMTGPDGTARQSTFDFKVDGEKLTGTAGSTRGSAEISEGKISGNDVSFVVVRKFNDQEFKMVYKGKVSGSEIKFTVSFGEERTFEMTAKKVS